MGTKVKKKTVAKEKKRKAPVPGPGQGKRRVTKELAAEMFAEYLKRPTATHLVETFGVAHWTAKKYIQEGDARRGIEPFQKRYARIQREADKKADYDLAKARADVQKVARAYFQKLAQRIADLKPEELRADRIASDLNKALTILERTFGVAEHQVAVRGGAHDFDGWSVDELQAFLENATLPDRVV